MVAPALVAELRRARERGELEGAGSEERFESFVASLREPGFARDRLDPYGGLVDRLATMAEDWVSFLTELFDRLEADWTELAAAVEGTDPRRVRVTGIEAVGDLHGPGRCVTVVTLAAALEPEGGADRGLEGTADSVPRTRTRWVYKPRRVGAEVAFGRLVRWLEPHLPVGHMHPRIVAREEYGWVAHTPRQPCPDRSAVGTFYRRLGHLAAALHLLLAWDIHAENVIACGAFPVVLDLEGVMPHRLSFHRAPEDRPKAHLLRSSLLPGRRPTPVGWLDTSAVAGVEGSGIGLRRKWRDAGSDRMEAVWRPALPDVPGNRPFLAGEPVEPLDWEDAFVQGFSEGFEAIMAGRVDLSGPDSPLRAFRGVRQRIGLESTSRYRFLLERSWSARAWRESGGRRRVFEALFEQRPEGLPEAVIPKERAALRAGYVPVFRSVCDGTDIRTGNGEPVTLTPERSGFDRVGRHLVQDFTPRGLEVQKTIVRQTFAARRRNRDPDGEPRWACCPLLDAPPFSADEAGDTVAEWVQECLDRLVALRVAEGSRTAWPTLRPDNIGWRPRLTGLSLAYGTSGIGWVLAHAGVRLDRVDYTDVARDCLRRIEAAVDDLAAEGRATPTVSGLRRGTSGWSYLLDSWVRLHDDEWARWLRARVSALPDRQTAPVEEAEAAIVRGEVAALDAVLESARREGDQALTNRVRGYWVREAGRTVSGQGQDAGRGGDLFVPGLRGGVAGRAYAGLRVLFPDEMPRLPGRP